MPRALQPDELQPADMQELLPLCDSRGERQAVAQLASGRTLPRARQLQLAQTCGWGRRGIKKNSLAARAMSAEARQPLT